MSHVKITHPGYPHGGTRLELDGAEVKGVTGIQLNFPVDGPAECHAGILVDADTTIDQGLFEFEAPMDAHLHFHVPEGMTIIEMTTHADRGSKLLVVRRSEEGT